MITARSTRSYRPLRLVASLTVAAAFLVSCSSDGESADTTTPAEAGNGTENDSLFCQDVAKVTDFQTAEAMAAIETNAPTAIKADIATLKEFAQNSDSGDIEGASEIQEEASNLIRFIGSECGIDLVSP